MKVNTPPPSTPELVQPGASAQGQSACTGTTDLLVAAGFPGIMPRQERICSRMGDITANPFTIIFGVALISLLPILVSIGTAFLKFVVVFNLLSDH